MWALCRLFFCLNAGILGIFHFAKVLSDALLRVWTGELQGWSKAFLSQLLYPPVLVVTPGRVTPKEQVPTAQPSSSWRDPEGGIEPSGVSLWNLPWNRSLQQKAVLRNEQMNLRFLLGEHKQNLQHFWAALFQQGSRLWLVLCKISIILVGFNIYWR